MTPKDTQIALRRLHSSDEDAKIVLNAIGDHPSHRSLSVKTAAKLLSDDYIRAREVLKKLQDSGVGQFIVGRKGHLSRLQWSYDSQSVGRVARNQSGSLLTDIRDGAVEEFTLNVNESAKPIPESQTQSPTEATLDFWLRVGRRVSISFPTDLNKSEAERVGAWLLGIIQSNDE